jgi:serine/threonine-protein kinase
MALIDDLRSALGSAYSIERELGGGGMSRVFVGEEVAFGRKVAVKVLAPELAAGERSSSRASSSIPTSFL